MGEIAMTDRLRTLTQKVWFCLEKHPETRSDDRELIKTLYDEFYGVWSEPFYMVLNRKELPSFESIRRCRQKIQEENEDLRAEKPIEDRRLDAQKEYIEYALGEEWW